MRFSIWLVTYNGTCGTDDLPQLAGEFLLAGPRRSFGSAVTSFELYAWVKTRSRALPTLGSMKNEWNASLRDLPRATFLRRNTRFDISFFSSLGTQEDFERKRTAAGSLTLFRALCHEIASALQLAKQRLKKTDDFDWNSFAAQVNSQLEKLPRNTRELSQLLKHLRKAPALPCADPLSPPRLSARTLKKKPSMIAIDHDEHHASHIGCLPDGRQFFLTTPFVPATGTHAGREFVALYLFDKRGGFLEARIDDLGTRAKLDAERARRVFDQRLAALGPVKYCRIRVEPFEVTRLCTTFGLVPRIPEDDRDEWCIEAQPGNYMAFFKPWNSGNYDT